ncbi:MAG: hypothetical protein ACKVJU_09545 [Verrucomicrobiales bacterium]
MSNQVDTEDYIEEYVKGTHKKRGATVTIVLLILLLLGAGGAAYVFGKRWSEGESKILQAERELKTLGNQIVRLETAKSELSSQLSDKQAELERIRDEWKTQVAAQETKHREQIQRTYAQMDEIVYDSRKTLEYIGTIEDKLKTGKALDEKESQQIQSVVAGISFLHQQYEKPIHEFRELERFLAEQLAVPASIPPKERYGLMKQMFKNKEFKAEQASFYREEGQRAAFDKARTKVSEAYSRAQSQMKALKLDSNKFLNDLDKIVASNNASVDEVNDFFAKSKEILKIHDKIMNLEPESGLKSVRP